MKRITRIKVFKGTKAYYFYTRKKGGSYLYKCPLSEFNLDDTNQWLRTEKVHSTYMEWEARPGYHAEYNAMNNKVEMHYHMQPRVSQFKNLHKPRKVTAEELRKDPLHWAQMYGAGSEAMKNMWEGKFVNDLATYGTATARIDGSGGGGDSTMFAHKGGDGTITNNTTLKKGDTLTVEKLHEAMKHLNKNERYSKPPYFDTTRFNDVGLTESTVVNAFRKMYLKDIERLTNPPIFNSQKEHNMAQYDGKDGTRVPSTEELILEHLGLEVVEEIKD